MHSSATANQLWITCVRCASREGLSEHLTWIAGARLAAIEARDGAVGRSTPDPLLQGLRGRRRRPGELRRQGLKIKLAGPAFSAVGPAAGPRGRRGDQRGSAETLWPADTYVDFDHSLNTAVRKLREALGDSAEDPRYVETIARRGYRFIAPVVPRPTVQ